MNRRPAEAFPVGEFVRDEMEARGWTVADVVRHMGPAWDNLIGELSIKLLIEVDDPEIPLGDGLASGLANAFGTSADYWLNLDRAWRAWALSRLDQGRWMMETAWYWWRCYEQDIRHFWREIGSDDEFYWGA